MQPVHHPVLPLKRRQVLVGDAAAAAGHFERRVAQQRLHVER